MLSKGQYRKITMAERQGKLGDSWNECACHLLRLLGWQHIGDTNVDLPGCDGKDYGIDSVMKYSVTGKKTMQTVLVESKRWSKNSIQSGTMQDWMERFKKKLSALRNSQKLMDEYPELEDCTPTNLGIIMCWVHDADEYYLATQFQGYLTNIKINSKPSKSSFSRIMLIDNRRIIKLCAMIDALKKYTSYKFAYPSGIVDNDVVGLNTVLSVEYMMSDVIIADAVKDNEVCSIAFYFGEMTESAMNSLLELLKTYQRVRENTPLVIHYSDNSDTCIDIINSFKRKESYKDIISFKKLEILSLNSEPAILSNDD